MTPCVLRLKPPWRFSPERPHGCPDVSCVLIWFPSASGTTFVAHKAHAFSQSRPSPAPAFWRGCTPSTRLRSPEAHCGPLPSHACRGPLLAQSRPGPAPACLTLSHGRAVSAHRCCTAGPGLHTPSSVQQQDRACRRMGQKRAPGWRPAGPVRAVGSWPAGRVCGLQPLPSSPPLPAACPLSTGLWHAPASAPTELGPARRLCHPLKSLHPSSHHLGQAAPLSFRCSLGQPHPPSTGSSLSHLPSHFRQSPRHCLECS